MKTPARRPHGGFTFVEVIVALVILAVVAMIAVHTIRVTAVASDSTIFRSELEQRVNRALTRVLRELQEARLDSIDPDPLEPVGASSFDYCCAEVSGANVIVWGAKRRLACVPSATDPRDGRDNDNDGFIDEHDLVLLHDVGLGTERRTVLVRNVAPLLGGESANAEDDNGNALVDESGFCVARRDAVIQVRLTLLGRDRHNHIELRTGEISVCPRN